MSLHYLILFIYSGQRLPTFLLYAGPDQILPLMSFLGAIIGVLLMFWHRLVALARQGLHFLTKKFQPSTKK